MQINSLIITWKYLLIFAFIICAIFLSSCIPLDPITLHGDIKGSVTDAETREIDFTLPGVPIPNISVTYLDFGLDLISLSFTISNIGKETLLYIINTSKDWITVNPYSGNVIDETDTIRVTINKTGLSDSIIYKEKIEITSTGGSDPLQDTIGVYLNGVLDIRDLRYYKIVRIGTQTWMAENLNAGEEISVMLNGTNNGIVEKTCYRDESINC